MRATGVVLLANLIWVYYRVPEYVENAKDQKAG